MRNRIAEDVIIARLHDFILNDFIYAGWWDDLDEEDLLNLEVFFEEFSAEVKELTKNIVFAVGERSSE